ncbi:MAG: DUF2339 domain-containing protein, partial [Chloroflexi bacterium]|nr:DUF2339 domain-containing protein [Chloroflexota bacterium]
MEGSRCPRCNRESRPGATFCMFCGAPLIAQAAPSGGPSAGEAQEARVAALERQAADIHRVLVQLSDRVSRLEGGGVAPASGPVLQPEAVGAQGQAQAPAPNVVYWGPPGEGLVPVAPGAPGAAQGQGEGPPVAGGMGMDWERVLGLNWLAIIGAVALTLGVGFFLRLAFENDWIGERGRIVLGLASGAALLGAGEYTQRRYPRWAQAVTGGGLGILYLSTYASFGFYDLIPPVPAFLFLGLVVLLGGLLAIRYESLVIALLGIAGAYLTPLLLGRQLEPAERYLVVLYIILVDAGILGVSTFRNWRWFTLIGLIASYSLFAIMMEDVPQADLLRMELGVTATFLIFVGATTLF